MTDLQQVLYRKSQEISNYHETLRIKYRAPTDQLFFDISWNNKLRLRQMQNRLMRSNGDLDYIHPCIR